MFSKRQFVLHTNLSPEQCIEQLRTKIGKNISVFAPLSRNPVLGRISGYKFRLRKVFYSNAFASYLYGELQGDAAGTRVICRFRLLPLMRVFVPIWFVGVSAFIMVCLFELFAETGSMAHAVRVCVFGIPGPGIILSGGLAIYGVGRLLGKREETYVKEFLQETLSARQDSLLDAS